MAHRCIVVVVVVSLWLAGGQARGERSAMESSLTSTFSIVACDPSNGDLGVAVASKSLAVGARVPYAKAGVGAVATQAYTNTSYGPKGLALLEKGLSPKKVIAKLTEEDGHRELRQVAVLDATGLGACHTGRGAPDWHGHRVGKNFVCIGNLIAGEAVVNSMADAFEKAKGTLAERLLAALGAGQAAGGDRRGQESAALLVVRKNGGPGGYDDRLIDLRVDSHPTPLKELRRLLGLAQGQARR